MNKQIAGGNLTEAAKLVPNGDREMLAFTVAANDGPDYAEFFQCTVWGKKGFADNVLPYLTKGQSVVAHGELIYPDATEKDNVIYQNSLVQLDSLRGLKLMGGKPTQSADAIDPPSKTEEQVNAQAAQMAQQASQQPAPDYDSFDDDIPF